MNGGHGLLFMKDTSQASKSHQKWNQACPEICKKPEEGKKHAIIRTILKTVLYMNILLFLSAN